MEKTIQEKAIDEAKLTVEAKFIPFSASRNKEADHKTLNWKVTVKRDGRHVLTTDYSAGIAHCPSYNTKAPGHYGKNPKRWQNDVCDFECEEGFAVSRHRPWSSDLLADRARPITPDAVDVIYSLVMDGEVLNYNNFEDWASAYGYDTDSIKAEKVYRECIKHALSFRNAMDAATFDKLQEAFQDY